MLCLFNDTPDYVTNTVFDLNCAWKRSIRWCLHSMRENYSIHFRNVNDWGYKSLSTAFGNPTRVSRYNAHSNEENIWLMTLSPIMITRRYFRGWNCLREGIFRENIRCPNAWISLKFLKITRVKDGLSRTRLSKKSLKIFVYIPSECCLVREPWKW